MTAPCRHDWEVRDHPHVKDMQVRRCSRCGMRMWRMLPPWTTSHLHEEDRVDFEWPAAGPDRPGEE